MILKKVAGTLEFWIGERYSIKSITTDISRDEDYQCFKTRITQALVVILTLMMPHDLKNQMTGLKNFPQIKRGNII